MCRKIYPDEQNKGISKEGQGKHICYTIDAVNKLSL